jgi:hypothetical protein
MLGWIMIFALMLIFGAIVAIGDAGPFPGVASSLVFGFLLVVSALTLLLRGRA